MVGTGLCSIRQLVLAGIAHRPSAMPVSDRIQVNHLEPEFCCPVGNV